MGWGQRSKVMKYGGGTPESPLSMGPERPRYATGAYTSCSINIRISWKSVAWVKHTPILLML